MIEMDKQYNSKSSELQIQQLWEQEKIYHFKAGDDREVYSIDTPPPTVSGSLHIGHVFSYTQTDLIARYKRLRGFNVFYPMGFDDNGLPTERFVEKKHGIKGHNMKRSDFLSLCLKETDAVEKIFEQLWRSIGLSVDWNKLYSTISPLARKVSQCSFIELFKKGHAYRKAEPSLFCTTCRTSVAQAELDSAELPSTFNDIHFAGPNGEKLLIATTRPELLPACVAVFYHPNDERYKNLYGKFATTPVFNKQVPILTDELVDPEKGTGLVMCCTFGDQTDIQWFKKHNLPLIQAINDDGKLSEVTGSLAGLNVKDARKKILELLDQEGSLVGQKQIVHHVSVHERCKQEIEFLVLWQWFINILNHKKDFLALADKIVWKPEFMKIRYQEWVENLNWDWCISRQRFFGIPFPVWHCNDCKQVLIADQTSLPIDPQETSYPKTTCYSCGSINISPDTDVMDTWNTSSLTPQINVHWPDSSPDGISLPMSMRPQAHDIIRTWAFDTIVKSFFHNKDIPWKDIVISGHVLAGKEKISKSKENSKLSPEGLLESYPADVVRYWTASARLGVDTAFSENQLKIGHRLVTKLWNAFRFCSEHISEFKKPQQQPKLDRLNEWLLTRLNQTILDFTKHFDEYEYHAALETAERFFWSDFCDNYLELVKDQFFNPEKYDAAIIEGTRFVLYEAGFGILQLFAPFTPFVTDAIYQLFYKQQEGLASLHATLLEDSRFNYSYEESVQSIKHVLDIVAAVRKLKSEQQISLKTELQTLVIHGCDSELNLIKGQEMLIKGVTKSQSLDFQAEDLEENSMVQDCDQFIAHVKVS